MHHYHIRWPYPLRDGSDIEYSFTYALEDTIRGDIARLNGDREAPGIYADYRCTNDDCPPPISETY